MKKSSAIDTRFTDNEGKAKIYIKVSIGRNFKKRISLPVRCEPKYFNNGFVDNEVPGARQINSIIKNELINLDQFENDMYLKGLEITPDLFKLWINPVASAESFIDFYTDVLEKDKTLVKSSYSDQLQTLVILKRFKSKIDFKHLTRMLVDGFHNFLIDEGYNAATIKKHHKNLKKYINKAIDYGKLEVTLDKHPYRGFKFSVVKNERVYLTEEELNKIAACKLDGRDADVRDLFLFACATGMRFIDTQQSKIEISDFKLSYTPIKTIKHTGKITLPVDAVCAEWVKLPPHKISNQEVNRYLKNIMLIAEINKLLTFHVARHTFLTHVARKTGSIFKVMKYGGLRKTDTAMIYVHLAGV